MTGGFKAGAEWKLCVAAAFACVVGVVPAWPAACPPACPAADPPVDAVEPDEAVETVEAVEPDEAVDWVGDAPVDVPVDGAVAGRAIAATKAKLIFRPVVEPRASAAFVEPSSADTVTVSPSENG